MNNLQQMEGMRLNIREKKPSLILIQVYVKRTYGIHSDRNLEITTITYFLIT